MHLVENNHWQWSEEDAEEFHNEEYLDHGKWVFFKAQDGKYEAIMHGLYMHVFDTIEDLQKRQNEVGFYEYDEKLAGQDKQFSNNKGETR